MFFAMNLNVLIVCFFSRPTDDETVRSYSKIVIPEFHVDKLKGFMGTVGIVGGSVEDTGAAYFAAMAAYKVDSLILISKYH